jgi:two-component system chemotaxis response regulator CheB
MIRVLVVDDSPFSRKVITNILEAIAGVEVADTARDGEEALKKTLLLHPDLITLDLEMPRMDGFTFLRWVMSYQPTPVIVVSANEANENVFKALDLGAVDFVVKPSRHASFRLEEIGSDLIDKVLAVPLLAIARIQERMKGHAPKPERSPRRFERRKAAPLIGIGSSTGGPPAIQAILKDLPSEFDVPILIAQHMPAGFTALFAERLNKVASLQVREAADQEPLKPGHAYIAPGGKHLTVQKLSTGYFTRIVERKIEDRYNPSADLLFTSLAQEAGASALGIVLTGMGDDGKKGLRHIKENGGVTIAESEQTAVIFGMPQEAIRAGVVDFVLPLYEIAETLSSLTEIKNHDT